MKKLLSLLLTLCLLLGLAPALAEAVPQEAALPAVGDVVNGFEVLEIRRFDLVGADVICFEHQKTGAKLMYIANDDTNRVFDLVFLTRPIDNTGLPHVFEHAVTDGSEKYPSKTLWFNAAYQTYNTFMNAQTFSVYTAYPVASLSEAQLLKLADFYTDLCLHPMVLEDESIFLEEAWRYRLGFPKDKLTVEGTVYSEMLGLYTLPYVATYNGYRAAFPGSVVGFDEGGDPDYIPDMTWEDLKNYHSLYYHPSNCVAYLYGQFEDYTAFLALLDDAFSPYDREEFVFEDSGYTAITGPVEEKFAFGVTEGSDTANQSMILYYLLLPGIKDDPQEEMILNTLTDLMLADSSPIMQSLRRALPTGTFGTYIETSAPDDAIVFYAYNVNEDDAELFKATVDEGLKEIAENGFPQDMVDGLMASLALSIRLTSESSDIGVDLINSIAYSYATSGDPFNYMDYVDAMSMMDEWNQQGLYKEAVAKYLLGNELTALATTYPEPGKKEEEDAARAAKLAQIKAGMTNEEIEAIIDRTNAPAAEEEDNSAYLAELKVVDVSSLPEEAKIYTVYDETDEDGVRHVDAVAGVDGIGRTNIYLDLQGMPQPALHWVKLLTDLYGTLDTEAHTVEELDRLVTRYFYDSGINISLFGEGEDYMPKFRMGWTSTDEDLATGYDLMYEIVFETKFDDADKLLARVQAIKAALRSTINGSAYNILLYRAVAITSPLYRYYNYINYLDYYTFLDEIETMLIENPDEVMLTLQSVQSELKNRTNAIAGFAGNEESIALNRALSDAFLARLEKWPIIREEYDLPVPAAREALILDVNVQYNAMYADYASLGMEGYDGSLDALTSMTDDMLLVPLLRDQYGVYTPFSGALSDVDGGMYVITYRDPNIAETFQVFDTLPERVAALNIDQDTLDGYILSAYAYYATSQGELSGALDAMLATILGQPQDTALTCMRQLKAVTPDSLADFAEIYRKLAENGVRSTAGGVAAIKANAALYDVILNPFNARDITEIVLVDVPEDYEHYAAVRFVFENGLMASLTDDTFGVDDDATVGDFVAALYCALGGSPNAAEEARDWLAGYGLMAADQDVNAPLTERMLCHIMNDGLGVGMTTDAPDAIVPRVDLADLMWQFFGQ